MKGNRLGHSRDENVNARPVNRAPRRYLLSLWKPFWVHIDQCNAEGLIGWVAPSKALSPEETLSVSGAWAEPVHARLKPDGALRAAWQTRPLYRFHIPFPVSEPGSRGAWRMSLAGHVQTMPAPKCSGGCLASQIRFVGPGTQPCKSRRVLLVLSSIDWEFRRQRQQQLSQALSVSYDHVLYLGPASLDHADNNLPVVYSLAEAISGVAVPFERAFDMAQDRLTASSAHQIAEQVNTLLKGAVHTDVLCLFPAWQPVIGALAANRVIYDLLDDHGSFDHIRADIMVEEQALIAQADLVTSPHVGLLQRADLSGVRNALVPNGFDPAALSQAEASHPRARRAVYLGAIESWFDWPLLMQSAETLSDIEFEIIGRVESLPPGPLPANVILKGEMPHPEAMKRLCEASVALIPFKVTALTRMVDPVKIYEYMAAGLPVVSTPFLDEGWGRMEGVELQAKSDGFADAVRRFAGDADTALRQTLMQQAQTASWSARARDLIAALNGESG